MYLSIYRSIYQSPTITECTIALSSIGHPFPLSLSIISFCPTFLPSFLPSLASFLVRLHFFLGFFPSSSGQSLALSRLKNYLFHSFYIFIHILLIFYLSLISSLFFTLSLSLFYSSFIYAAPYLSTSFSSYLLCFPLFLL